MQHWLQQPGKTKLQPVLGEGLRVDGGENGAEKRPEVIRAVLSRAKRWGTFAQQTCVPALCRQGHGWPVPSEGCCTLALPGSLWSLRTWSLGTLCHAMGSFPL